MPRNGSGVYSHPFPDVVEGTTIESAVFNGNTSDVEQDLNTPRPIVAGGTGANNAHDAMIALSGEIAGQNVTNYSSHPFVAGSFWSVNATGGPTGDSGGFSGICHPYADPNYMTIEARAYAGAGVIGAVFVRQKNAGTWGAWAQQPGSVADLDAAYVNVSGDTMTGGLGVNNPPAFGWPLLVRVAADANVGFNAGGTDAMLGVLNNAGSAWGTLNINATIKTDFTVQFNAPTASSSPTTGALTVAGGVGVGGTTYFGNIAHWVHSGSPGAGGWYGVAGTPDRFFVGTDVAADTFRVYAGGLANNAVVIQGATGAVGLGATTASTSPTTGALTVAGGVGVGGAVIAGGGAIFNGGISSVTAPTTGTFYFGSGTGRILDYNGTFYTLVGGQLRIDNPGLMLGSSGTTGAVYFANTGSKQLNYDGTNFNLLGGALNHNGNVSIISSAGTSTTPPSGYAISMSYGGATQYGIAMRCVNDSAGYNALTFLNAFVQQVGAITCSSAATSFTTTSNAELKEDLRSFDAGNIIDNTNVYDFKWKASDERAYGVIAQQAVDVYPTAVTHTINPQNEEDEYWGVDYSKYVPVLLQELKALRTRVRDLEGRLDPKPA